MFKSRDLMIDLLGAGHFACGPATKDTNDDDVECGPATKGGDGGDTGIAGIASIEFDALRHQLRQTLGL